MNETTTRIAKVVLLIILVCSFESCFENYGPIPPSSATLTYAVSFPMVYTPGTNYLEALVDGNARYLTPNDGNDCGHNHTNTHLVVWPYTMQNPPDYIDFTLNDREGIGPGLGQSKSYQLVWLGETPDVWNLNMRQGTPTTDFLHIVRWRIK